MAWGHAPERVWAMTPRQAAAWAELGHRRELRAMSAQLMIGRMAAHAEGADVQRQLREWDA